MQYYQPFLLPLLRRSAAQLAPGISRSYWYSFEDCLWQLLPAIGVAQGSVILIPNFYCMDVIHNIEQHGYQVQLYRLDEHFQADRQELKDKVSKYSAKMIFIFHACGITQQTLENIFSWLPEDCFVLEDCVHRLLNPAEVQLLHPRHLILDSLRKVSPLPGSFLYASQEIINKVKPLRAFSLYTFNSTLLFILFRWVLWISSLFHMAQLSHFAHKKILWLHDEIIGDSKKGYAGLPGITWLHAHLDFSKIEATKQAQVEVYQHELQRVFQKHPEMYQIDIPTADFKKLHVYPVGFHRPPNAVLERYLLEKGFSVWFKFPDCTWSQDKSVLFLPLGMHVQDVEVIRLCLCLEEYSTHK